MQRSDMRREMNNAYLTIHRNASNNSNDTHFTIQNVSRGGIRFSSEEHFDIDERVSLALYINGELSHQAKGRICYHDEDSQQKNYYGVSFLDKFLHI